MSYSTILIDCPWPMYGGGKIKRGAQKHYPLLSVEAIDAVVRLQLEGFGVADHAHLYSWTTSNYLPDALLLMQRWGFRYVTNVAWAKTQTGLGQYFRGKHELLLFGVRGKGQHESVYTDVRDVPSCVVADNDRDSMGRRIHSRKPAVFHDLIERRSKGPYLELFGRQKREGWTVWGNDPAVTDSEDEAEADQNQVEPTARPFPAMIDGNEFMKCLFPARAITKKSLSTMEPQTRRILDAARLFAKRGM